MLAAVILGSTEDLVHDLQRACGQSDELHVYKSLDQFPERDQLLNLLNTMHPEVVFLEITSHEAVLSTLAEIQGCFPSTAIIGFASQGHPGDRIIQAELGRLLVAPFDSQAIQDAALRAVALQRAKVPDNVLAFVPAKAGSGATTVALHVAGYLASAAGDSTLLVEADLHSGALAALLNVVPQHSIIDALENCHWLDAGLLGRMVVHTLNFDALLAPPPTDIVKIMQWNCRRLLALVRSQYKHVIVDLPEVINPATEAIIMEARRTLVVCTPEKASLFLARRRIQHLLARGAKESRLDVILNRHSKLDPPLQEIENTVGWPITLALPNDYLGLRRATEGAGLVRSVSPLGREYRRLIEVLAAPPAPKLPPPETSEKKRSLGLLLTSWVPDLGA